MDAPRNKAFISYSHRDESWARWLQHSLESCRIPKRLVGEEGAFGPIPERLRPVFRDREDLSSASDLTTQIRGELANSDTLIVICSPAAASSRWVNEEIRYFHQLGKEDRILALIVEGDPHAVDGGQNCFPAAIQESPDGTRREPLAADVRRYADGKYLSKLKIVAGVLGIRLDELRRRDAQRRNRNRFLYAFAALFLGSVIGWLMNSVVTTRSTAAAQHANTEDLLRYMLGDLERLDPIKGLESISPENKDQVRLREQLGLEGMDSDTLVEQALAWRKTGIDLKWEGELEAAMQQFTNSRAAIIELHLREGNSPRALFELGQSEFHVGEVYIQMGEMDLAQQYWSHYGALTRRLLNTEPNNPKYVMELSYTLMNLGALELTRLMPDVSKSLELLQVAVQYNQMALVLDPGNPEFGESLMNQLAWLADAWIEKCALGNAFEMRQQTVDLRREMVAASPDDVYQQHELAITLGGLAGVQQHIGLHSFAIASFEEAVEILHRLQQAESENVDIEWQALYREARLARLLMALGAFEQAASIINPMAPRIRELSNTELNSDHFFAVEAAFFLLDQAKLWLALGEVEQGEKLLRTVIEQLSELVRLKPGFQYSLQGLAAASFVYWQQIGEKPGSAVDSLLGQYLSDSDSIENCTDASLAARLAISDGNTRLAKRYTRYVRDKGYFEPDFVAFCRKYQLCDLP
jgi:tetratricopeptide (TPR) repeat protein